MIAQHLQDFDARLPRISEFADVAEDDLYVPLPDRWLVGTSDVVNSTGAIAAGRYKAVNMVGASVIAAVRNALDAADIPFVFGGDGASFVVPEIARGPAEAALAAVRTWADEEIGLQLRAALVPIERIRRAGFDVRVARFAVTPDLSYAMFAGDGIAWAESQMKADAFVIAPASPGTTPDLTSLSCRWQPIESLRGHIASLLVTRRETSNAANYRTLVRDIITYIHEREIEEGRPVSYDTAKFALSQRAIALETRATRRGGSYVATYAKLSLFYVLAWYLFLTGRPFGKFDPGRYRDEAIRNTDFRKFDDGLKLTIDCSDTTLRGLRTMLDEARANDIADYGLHAQDTALMTCIVPSHLQRDHMHFVDGAGGGYAKAAEMLKAQLAEAKTVNRA